MQPTIAPFLFLTSIIQQLYILSYNQHYLYVWSSVPYMMCPELSFVYNFHSITMDLDFILFQPPKLKYSFLDFWGEVIFIPKTRKKQYSSPKSLAQFLNCYKNVPPHQHTANLIDPALFEGKSLNQLQSVVSEDATVGSGQDEEVEKYIPCLFLNSMVGSRFLLLYFHSSGEDIKLCHQMLDLLRNLYQINVLAMEYEGYSIYRGSPSTNTIKQDSLSVYQYVTQKLGFKRQNTIVMGRSIGTGVALELMRVINPGALVLISPFSSIKSLAREFVGFLGQLLAKQTFDNRANMELVACPTFLLHGRKDTTISYENTIELAKLCEPPKVVKVVQDMTHSNFDFYTDLLDPLREFLMAQGFEFYQGEQKGPTVPDWLFKQPEGFTF